MANATHRDDFDRQLSEFAGQYNARSARTWLTTLPGSALARRASLRRLGPASGDHRQILCAHTRGIALLHDEPRYPRNGAGACRTGSDHRRAG